MGRVTIDVPVPALALRRAEAAAACGVSVETFDSHIRAHVPACRVGSVVTYPVDGLREFLAARSNSIADDMAAAR
jgi:hypothetical protein